MSDWGAFRLKIPVILKNYILILILLISIFNVPYFIPGGSGSDIVLGRSEILTMTGISTCDNITLSGEATLIVKNADLRVNGIIRMSEYSRLFVENSRLAVNPPDINDSTIVVHITDNAMIKVTRGSLIQFNPQPNPTNISYMLMEDSSEFFIIESSFKGYLPSIIDQSIEVASVTAGVYLLSGSATWYMIDSDITGRVSLDGGDLTGRWFWASLHQRSSLFIERTEMELLDMSSSYTLLKPVSGSVTLIDSLIHGGKVDVEVAAQTEMINTTFNSIVRFMDSTISSVSECTFAKDVSIGTTLAITEGPYNPETAVEISHSKFQGRLRCIGNSTTSIFESTFDNLYAGINSSIGVINSSIQGHFSIRDHCQAVIKNTDIDVILLDDSITLDFEGKEELSSITFYGNSHYQEKGAIYFSGITVNSTVFQSEFNNTISFVDAEILDVRFYNEIHTTFELINSSIETITPLRSGENVSLTFIVVGSQTPDLMILDKNITVQVYYRVEVLVTLNGLSIDTLVEVSDDFGQVWSKFTEDGRISFDLHYKTKQDNNIRTTLNYQVSTTYLALSETKPIVLVSSITLIFDLQDPHYPEMTGITCGPSEWNLGKSITVSVDISDRGVESVNSTKLFYRIDGGPWKELSMFKISENSYEVIIPEQSESGVLSLYIESDDKAGNIAKSETIEVSVGQEENFVFYGGILALIIVIAAILINKIIIRKKIKSYASKYEFKRKK
jgi:hypothetical protein